LNIEHRTPNVERRSEEKRSLAKGVAAEREALRTLTPALSHGEKEEDERISQNGQLLNNPAYTETMMLRLIVEQLKTHHQLPLTADSTRFINSLVMKEYLDEFNGQQPA
jgi:type I restriction enzyme, R subunit